MPFTPTLIREAQARFGTEQMNDLEDAFQMAKQLYGHKKHHYGGSLLAHVEQSTRLMLPLHPDATTIISALLQHAHSKEELTMIEERFGKRVSTIISYVSLLEEANKNATLSAAYLRKMTLVLSEDIRVLFVCLHNRWYHLQHSDWLKPKQRILLAREVLDVFAPISARLGMYALRYEIESLAFEILYPQDADEIHKKMNVLRKAQGPLLGIAKQSMSKLLNQENIRVTVLAREKHAYSIFRKMNRKNVSKVTDLQDLFGIRILLDSIDDCYRALGIIHRTYRPILHRVKDYISFPKPNGYRSVHTTVLGLNVKDASTPIEVQIRTHEMEEQAEYGIAAHWNYKEGGLEDPVHMRMWQERMASLRTLPLDTTDDDSSDDLQEAISDRIYVMTPKGDPIELPKGAIPLDFAFRIHTDVGLQCRAAKVNGAIAPIDQPLENGDMVEIQRHKNPQPSEQWMPLLKTKEAKQKLRTYLRSVGKMPEHGKEEKITKAPPLKKKVGKLHEAGKPPVLFQTETPLPYRFAQCCKPDVNKCPSIIGFATRDAIITVHRKCCHMLSDANYERIVKAEWK